MWTDIALIDVEEAILHLRFRLLRHADAANRLTTQPGYLSRINRITQEILELSNDIIQWQNLLRATTLTETEYPPDAPATHTTPEPPTTPTDPTHDHTPLGRTANPPYETTPHT
jgi:predicted pyridoxine 5'-phosphate oxidase superfamily flavin-nucleotide-binding protein